MARCPFFNTTTSLTSKTLLNVAGSATLAAGPTPEFFAQSANFALYGFTPPPIGVTTFRVNRVVIQSNLKDGSSNFLAMILAAQFAGGFVDLVPFADGNGDWSGEVVVPNSATALVLAFAAAPTSGKSISGFYDWSV